MPDTKDYYAYKSTSGRNEGGGIGCSGGPFTWIIGFVLILWIIGKLSG